MQLQELERNRNATQKLMAEREKRNSELKSRLLELKKGQEAVAEKLERAREEQKRLKALLEQKVENKENISREVLKLKPYTQQSPTALEDSLRNLNDRLTQDKSQVDTLDRRARALQTSTDSFNVVASDVTSCTRLLTDVQADLAKEEEELSKASRHRDALSDRSRNVQDVERQEKLLQKQLSNVNARTEKLKNKSEEEAEKARRRMEELREVHAQLAEERGEKGREMERRRVRIEQTEKKVRHDEISSLPRIKVLILHRWPISRTASKPRFGTHTTSTSRWRVTSSSTLPRWSKLYRRRHVHILCHSVRWIFRCTCRRAMMVLVSGLGALDRGCNLKIPRIWINLHFSIVHKVTTAV
jgi:chromosome segregation ATPase